MSGIKNSHKLLKSVSELLSRLIRNTFVKKIGTRLETPMIRKIISRPLIRFSLILIPLILLPIVTVKSFRNIKTVNENKTEVNKQIEEREQSPYIATSSAEVGKKEAVGDSNVNLKKQNNIDTENTSKSTPAQTQQKSDSVSSGNGNTSTSSNTGSGNNVPTDVPTSVFTPTLVPTAKPTNIPTSRPTAIPTVKPTNTPTIVPTLVPKPDLIITTVSVSFPPFKVASWNYLHVEVKNQGSATFYNNSNIEFTITDSKGNNTSCQAYFGSIGIGQTISESAYCIAYNTGQASVSVKVDANNVINELNESNNSFSDSFYIYP